MIEAKILQDTVYQVASTIGFLAFGMGVVFLLVSSVLNSRN